MLESVIKDIQSVVWGPWLVFLLLGVGVIYTFSLRFIQVRELFKAFRYTFRAPEGEGDISHYKALTTAISATVGVGNIAGVATAIASGGPGAVFWMWMTGFFGAATKYSEAVLAVRYRIKTERGMSGGPMFYISRGLGFRRLAIVFSICCAIAAFGIGNLVQSNTAAEAISHFGISKQTTGLIMTILTSAAILGGIKSIGAATFFISPFMIFFYTIFAIYVIFINIESLPSAFLSILKGAFSPISFSGGISGSVVKYYVDNAIRFGVARGIFSNEAGLGSSPIAAAAARTHNPKTQALVSMTQVYIDSLFVNTLTALSIVSTNSFLYPKTGVALTSFAFSTVLGNLGSFVVSISVSMFAFSTILGWSYYGEKAVEFLLGKEKIIFYRILWIVSVFIGAVSHLETLWNMSDIMNALMAVPNIIALLLLVKIVKKNS